MGGSASVLDGTKIDEARCRELLGDSFSLARFTAETAAEDGCIAMRAVNARQATPSDAAQSSSTDAHVPREEMKKRCKK